MTNTFLDHPHLRFPFGFVWNEHKRLKSISDMAIHEIDHPKVFAEPPQSVALVYVKD